MEEWGAGRLILCVQKQMGNKLIWNQIHVLLRVYSVICVHIFIQGSEVCAPKSASVLESAPCTVEPF